jgi:hypothetical protein
MFTEQELKEVEKKLKNNKAPGPDGIPNEVICQVIKHLPQKLLQLYNRCLSQGKFVKEWKTQKLVLLRKGIKPTDQTSSYRPICLMDTMGKVLEGLILMRLEDHLRKQGGLAGNQFGFRKGRSTIHAIQEVVSTIRAANSGKGKRNGFTALISIDVKNAINSIRWKDIIDALKKNKCRSI